jgi:hypothetical protein
MTARKKLKYKAKAGLLQVEKGKSMRRRLPLATSLTAIIVAKCPN